MTNEFTTLCADGCETGITFPPAATNPDCVPELLKSSIGDLILRPTDAPDPFGASWTGEGATVAVTAETIDNTATDNTKSRRLRGIGSLGESTSSDVPGPYATTIKGAKTHPFEMEVLDVGGTNRAFARALQCAPTNFTAYFGTIDNLFGKAGGLAVKNLDVQLPLGAGVDDYQKIIIRFDIDTQKVSPERTANNPFA